MKRKRSKHEVSYRQGVCFAIACLDCMKKGETQEFLEKLLEEDRDISQVISIAKLLQ